MSNTLDKDKIYRDYSQKVTRYVASKVGDYNQVEDLVSTIFVKVYSNWDKFDEEKASISTWIYTIANNTVLDYYRTRKVYDEMPEDIVDATEGLDEGLLREELLDSLAEALAVLPQRERDLIVLHYYHNLTLKTVAEKMNMSYANVKIVHKKAIAMLQNKMNT